MTVNPSTTLMGTVEKIIRPCVSSEPERRIENALTDAAGNRVHLKPGARVQLTLEAEPHPVTTRYEL